MTAAVRVAAALWGCLSMAQVHAQAYPTRPVRLVIPFAPGGGADIAGRIIAQRLAEQLGQTVIPDNRAGAGGNLGAEIVAKAPPDGYTVLLTTNSIAVNASLYAKLGYSLAKDLAPVTMTALIPLVLVTHPSVPAKTVKELVALGKRRQGGLNFGSNGSGTTSHLSGVLLNTVSGANAVHIPYRGGGPLMTALLSGEIDMGFSVTLVVQPHVRAGRLRALAVTTPRPAATMPEVPTMASFFPGFDTNVWHGVFVPAGTLPAVVSRLHDEFVRALQAPQVRTALERDGAEPIGTTPAEFSAILTADIEKYATLVRSSGAKPD
jgi:tripartite-type tricarboxylate transporter receptor subunit TctC